MKNSNFKQAYLKTLHIIKEDADEVPETPAETPETETEETPLQQVCFKTSDQALIDAINSGFEEVVFFVKSTNDDGEETVEEVKFKADSFGDVNVTEVTDEEEPDDEIEESDPTLEGDATTTPSCPECDKDNKDDKDDEKDPKKDPKDDQDDEQIDDTDEECDKSGKFLGRKPSSAFESVLSRIKKKYIL